MADKDTWKWIAAGVVAGHLIAPGWSQEDVDNATPAELAAHRKDLNGGRNVALIFLAVLAVGVFFLLFVH